MAEARLIILTQHVEGDVAGHDDTQAVVSFAGDDAPLVFSAHTYTHLGPMVRQAKR